MDKGFMTDLTYNLSSKKRAFLSMESKLTLKPTFPVQSIYYEFI